MHYFIGLVMMAAGVGMIFKTEWLVANFGTNAWAEQNMGTSGGSRIFYKLIGLAITFIGILVVTNLFSGFLMGTVGKIFIR